jgi:hypothetical protein
MHMVVLVGMAYWAASRVVIEAPSSIEKPREGECMVNRLPGFYQPTPLHLSLSLLFCLPMTLIILYP